MVADFFLAALLQFTHYVVLTVNYRAVAHKQTRWAMATDAAAVLFSYFIIRNIAEADGFVILAGMLVGGTMAAWAGIKATEEWGDE